MAKRRAKKDLKTPLILAGIDFIEKPKAKTGRPRADIKAETVVVLAKLGMNYAEIARALCVSEWTIRRRFARIIDRFRELRRTHLRLFQWRAAEKGSVPMLIFLGKNELGQSDDPVEIAASAEQRTVTVMFVPPHLTQQGHAKRVTSKPVEKPADGTQDEQSTADRPDTSADSDQAGVVSDGQ